MKAETKRQSPSRSTSRTASAATLTEQRPQRMLPKRSSAWDPFEVWRTRVKAGQNPDGAAE
jgi:hypothetical protein